MKVVRLFLITALLAVTCATGRAGQRIRGFGLKAGLSISRISGSTMAFNARRTFSVGGFLTLSLNKFLGLQPELLYSSKGANAHVVFPGSEGQIIIKLDYVEMPILAKILLLNGERWDFDLVIGPVLSKNIRRTVEYKGVPDFGDHFGHGHDFDRGLVFGSDFCVSLSRGKVILAPRYYLGFADIDGIKNRSFSFMVGYSK